RWRRPVTASRSFRPMPEFPAGCGRCRSCCTGNRSACGQASPGIRAGSWRRTPNNSSRSWWRTPGGHTRGQAHSARAADTATEGTAPFALVTARTEHAPGERARVLALLEHDLAAHDHVRYAVGALHATRRAGRSVVGDFALLDADLPEGEHHDVG